MKRYLTILLLALLPMICFAQDHMKFMGIPMNMTINQFQSKLAEKGIKVSPDNKNTEVGRRVFEGRFAGYDAHIWVSYIPSSKIVYSCAVFVDETTNKSYVETVIDNYYNNVSTKYDGYYEVTEDTYDGFDKYIFHIYNKNYDHIGRIIISGLKYDYGGYSACIHYIDDKNCELYKQNNMNDF